MEKERSNQLHPIDEAIKNISLNIRQKFTQKWSKHVHVKPTTNCNKIIVLDGNWKLTRVKCAYDNFWRKSDEFKEYRVGCPKTPERMIYFCQEHKDHKLIFKKGDELIQIQPNDIKISRISLYQI